MTLVRLIARPMLASMFVTGGIHAIKNADALAARARPVTDRLGPSVERATAALPFEVGPTTMVRANAVLHVVAGSMLATGRMPRLSAFVLAGSMVPTTLGEHRYWEEGDPKRRANQRTHFFKNISTIGGLLLASVDTEGRPSLAWRAKHQAAKAKDTVAGLTSH
jgi:uncharacterized membrane protein YphA (DoxX/SURF4 family)